MLCTLPPPGKALPSGGERGYGYGPVPPSNSLARRAPPALAPVPSRCHLCGGDRMALRFPARGAGGPLEAGAFRCTSFGHRSHPPIWSCEECGLLFQWPAPAEGVLRHAYGEVVDPLYLAERQNRLRTFRRVVSRLGPGNGRRLLDVGAYCGLFLAVAKESGFAAEGLELSRWAAAHARALGFPVREETLAERARAGARYDVLTMWDVLEHLPDPRRELEAAFRLLRPGGRLYLSTIDAGSAAARLLGPRWPWLMDMHLFYFDRSTVRVALEEAGFRMLERRSYVHTVSADYLLRKLAAGFPALAPIARALRRLIPGRWPVPVNLGDNMLVVAERP